MNKCKTEHAEIHFIYITYDLPNGYEVTEFRKTIKVTMKIFYMWVDVAQNVISVNRSRFYNDSPN